MRSRRIALGTAQFGSAYGVANTTGQVADADLHRMLAVAREHGVDTLDTAVAYGESEERLGRAGMRGWRIVTKLPALGDGVADVSSAVHEMMAGSLRRLRVDGVYAVLLHRPAQLRDRQGAELYAALMRLKTDGLAEKVGVSIYDPSELDDLWSNFPVDVVQAPFNVFDARLASSGWLTKLDAAHVEVHARSVFLQGLLLMPAEERPPYFDRWSDTLRRWDSWLEHHGASALQASLGFVLACDEIDRAVVGADTPEHLLEVLAVSSRAAGTFPEDMASGDLELINPALWRKE